MSSNTTAPAYDPAQPNGGDSLVVDVNAQYAGYEYNYVYLMISACMVWLIVR